MQEKVFKVFNQINRTLQENESLLNSLDNQIGDGDHGSNMVRGWGFAMEKIEQKNTVKETLLKIGQTLLSKVGGAAGPLYGIAFIKGAGCLHETSFDLGDFQSFVRGGTQAIQKLGKAQLGDKTMVDVWLPTCHLLEQESDLATIASKIRSFSDQTKNLLAKKGRASYLGKRSVGTIDPGSVSSRIILSQLLRATC